MGNFFTSLFSSSKKNEDTVEEKVKNDQKNFDILKYDGVRAQKMGQVAYAIKCFTEALNIEEDFETMNYLVSAYSMTNETGKALDVLNRERAFHAGLGSGSDCRLYARDRARRFQPSSLVPDGES